MKRAMKWLTCSPFFVVHLHVVFPFSLIFHHEFAVPSLALWLSEFPFHLVAAANVASVAELDISFVHNQLSVALTPKKENNTHDDACRIDFDQYFRELIG